MATSSHKTPRISSQLERQPVTRSTHLPCASSRDTGGNPTNVICLSSPSAEHGSISNNIHKLRNELWNWIEQQSEKVFGVDNLALIDEVVRLDATFEIGNSVVRKDVRHLEEEIIKVRNIYIENASCKICLRVLLAPFLTQCGHIHCGGCLKKQFEERLLRALQALETSTTDLTSNKLRGSPTRLAQHMADNGLNPRDAFCHPCPTCGLMMDSPPIFSIRMHLLTIAMYGVLGPLRDDPLETALEGFSERQSFLASFFLMKQDIDFFDKVVRV